MSRLSLGRIVVNAMAVTGVDRDMLLSKQRSPQVVLCRELVVAAARAQQPVYSYPVIARAIGRPNHSTTITTHNRLPGKYPDGRIVGWLCDQPVTFQNLLWVVTRDRAVRQPAVILNPRTAAVA